MAVNGGEIRGTLIEELPGDGTKSKFGRVYYRIMPLVGLIPVIYFLAMGWAFNTYDIFGPILFWTFVILFFVVGMGGTLILNHYMTPRFVPLRLYTNGIERKASMLERLRGYPDYIDRMDIERGEFKEFHYRVEGRPHDGTNSEIILRSGRKVRLGSRDIDSSYKVAENLRMVLRIGVTWDGEPFEGRPKARKVLKPNEQPAPTANRDAFCTQCGGGIGMDDGYCTNCGRKVGM